MFAMVKSVGTTTHILYYISDYRRGGSFKMQTISRKTGRSICLSPSCQLYKYPCIYLDNQATNQYLLIPKSDDLSSIQPLWRCLTNLRFCELQMSRWQVIHGVVLLLLWCQQRNSGLLIRLLGSNWVSTESIERVDTYDRYRFISCRRTWAIDNDSMPGFAFQRFTSI